MDVSCSGNAVKPFLDADALSPLLEVPAEGTEVMAGCVYDADVLCDFVLSSSPALVAAFRLALEDGASAVGRKCAYNPTRYTISNTRQSLPPLYEKHNCSMLYLANASCMTPKAVLVCS